MPQPRATLARTGLAACAALLLAACTQAPETAPPTSAADPAPMHASSVHSGIDLAGMDHRVRAGDDFFALANGTWVQETEIPADRSSTGAFLVAHEKARERTRELIRAAAASGAAPGTPARLIADFHAAWMDTDAIERHGLEPIRAELDAIAAIDTRSDLARVLGAGLRQDVDPINATHFHTANLFGLFVAQGLEDPGRNMAHLLQGGLLMPNRAWYLDDAPAMQDARAAWRRYATALLEAADTPDAADAAARVLALETKIATAHASIIDSEDVHRANNPWPRSEWPQRAPGLDWDSYFDAAGLADQAVINAWQPEAIAGLAALVASEPLADWRALLRLHALDAAAPLLPARFAALHFAFHEQALQGVPEQQPRWQRAVDATSAALGFAVGRLYVEHDFPPAAKQAAEAMSTHLITAFGERLEALEWMTPETREKAREKLATLRVQVGHPEHWPSLEGLEISADDALTNARNIALFHTRARLARLGQPVDPDHWWMTPQTVNAINLPLENELQFPAAILQPPFFDAAADPARNYGAIGAIIGHEISHSFDNMGAEFDAGGRLHNWWTPEDKAHFDAQATRLAEQFDAYEALPGLHLNGRQTLGENIADLAGLAVAHQAWRDTLGGEPAPVIDGLTGEQRFFLAYAQAWRGKMREGALRQRVQNDVHAPGPLRVRTVRNLDAWYDAFDVAPGDALYLEPAQRVHIW